MIAFKKKVFIADDNLATRRLITGILSDKYDVICFSNGFQLNEYIQAGNTPDVVLLDIVMPMDGIETGQRIHMYNKKIPLIAVSGQLTDDMYKELFENNFYDAIEKPFNIQGLRKKVANAVRDSELLTIHETEYAILLTFANMEVFKDINTHEHNSRISSISYNIAKKMDLNDDFCKCIRSAAVLHDIGKLIIPDTILNKEGKLTIPEFEIIKTHTTKGGEILKQIAQTGIIGFEMGQEVALKHHEKLDGSGYPCGINNIPLYVQIVTVADMYDAIKSKRAYHQERSKEECMKILNEDAKNNKINLDILSILDKITE
jgi:putative two-component system response regulator